MNTRTECSTVDSKVQIGFHELDDLIGELRGGQIIVIAGRPAMGKTTMAMNIINNACLEDKQSVYVLSLELSSEQFVKRLIELIGEVDNNQIQNGNIDDTAWDRLVRSAKTIAESGLILDDTAGEETYEYFCKTLRRLRRENNVSMAVVDYIQLMGCGQKMNSRNGEITYIMTGLKKLAQELQIPIIVLSQLSRRCERRNDHRPVLTDIRETALRSHCTDIVLFIYRDGYYSKEQYHTKDYEKYAEYGYNFDKKRDAEVIVAKHPSISVPITIHLSYDPKDGGFRNPEVSREQ